MKLTYAELSTILAALRYAQWHFINVVLLDDEEIDELCERLNTEVELDEYGT